MQAARLPPIIPAVEIIKNRWTTPNLNSPPQLSNAPAWTSVLIPLRTSGVVGTLEKSEVIGGDIIDMQELRIGT
jgi:hypothetical protein